MRSTGSRMADFPCLRAVEVKPPGLDTGLVLYLALDLIYTDYQLFI